MIQEIDYPIDAEEENIIFHQVLMALRSRVFYKCTIFSAITKHSVAGDIMTLYHLGYRKKAIKIITNLVILYKERFGQGTAKWFTSEAVEEAKT